MPSSRVDGLLVSWNDDRGFGFLRPADGSANVFVHISEFGRMVSRPQVGDLVSYRPGTGKNGRPQALDARGPGRLAQQAKRAGPGSLIVVLAFVAAYFTINLLYPVPQVVALIYAAASVLTFGMYALDKSRAKSGGWRVSEITLLFLGLLGGWPGAIVAQLVFRHKTVKSSFRRAFWATVIVNIVIFLAVVFSPTVAATVPTFGELLNG